jgi:hypothetical protein
MLCAGVRLYTRASKHANPSGCCITLLLFNDVGLGRLVVFPFPSAHGLARRLSCCPCSHHLSCRVQSNLHVESIPLILVTMMTNDGYMLSSIPVAD